MEASQRGKPSNIEEVFGDRLKKGNAWRTKSASGGPLALVLPLNAEEIEILARLAQTHDLPVIAAGAGLSGEVGSEEGSIVVRFDLMRRTRLPDGDEPWAEAEPGALWITLDNELRLRGRGLAVYPTSAPRATVGGWLAVGGLGVGSFEYGWLHDNVLSADVVLPGGVRREVPGEDLHSVVGVGGTSGIIVNARLRTRRADADVPFAAAFKDPEDLAGALASIIGTSLPLWHLAFLSPGMTRARHLGKDYLIFGAYPEARTVQIEDCMRSVLGSQHGRVLSVAEAHNVWGERFFPVAPSHPTPGAVRRLVAGSDLAETLMDRRVRAGEIAVQGSITRSGEALLLSFDKQQGSMAK
jgi:FAD/FMN-containing dehydrogenase